MATTVKRSGAAARLSEAEQTPQAARSWWQSLRATLGDSAWTALCGKAAVYVAGFFALALVGSGHARSLLPHRSTGTGAALGLVYGGSNAVTTPPTEAALGSADAGAPDSTDAAAAEDNGGSAASAPEGGGSVDAGAPAGGVTADGKVVLNLATEAEMLRLPGVGPVKAKAILALRSKLKRFRKVDDLLRIKGIGRRSLKRLRPLVLVDLP